ncbi:MAG: TylF/MycF family methyltransferase [Arenicellales bacterium]
MVIDKEGMSLYVDLMKKVLTASIYDESGWENKSRSSKNLLIRYLENKSILLVKVKDFDASKREEGRDWPFFGYTMAGHKRLNNVQKCLEDILQKDVPGDLIETGAWRGGTTIFMRALLKAYGVTDRKVWVADSFEGLPVPKNKADGKDLSQVDYLKVSLEEVKSNFIKFGLLDEQVEFLKGWFCDTLPVAPINEIAILRLDGDLYSSTMDALENLYHKVHKGGYVIVDDYYSWAACRRAVTDFLEKKEIQPEIMTIDWTGAFWQV